MAQDQNQKRKNLKNLVEQALGLGPLEWSDTDHYGGSATASLPGDYYVSVIVEIGESHRHFAILDSGFTRELTIEEYKTLNHSTNT